MLHQQKLAFRRARRAKRVRKTVFGTPERPRLSVHRSIGNMHLQVIDDTKGITLVAATTVEKTVRETTKTGGNKKAAATVGALIAKRAIDKGIKKVVFDRGGLAYHGRVKEVAEAARKAGLSF